MAIVESHFEGPADLVFLKNPSGAERILINGVDVSFMTMGYKIESRPNHIKTLCLYIPIASIKTIEE